VVEALNPPRDFSRTPLFQVVLAFQNAPEASVAATDTSISPMSLEGHTAKFDVSLFVTEAREGWNLDFEYNTDLFDAATIERLASHFDQFLRAALRHPHQRIAELPMLSADEESRIAAWAGATGDYPRDMCLHELFEAQVARAPSRVAVVSGATRLTYAELDARADALADVIVRVDIPADSLVAVVMEKGWEQVCAVLAIHKAARAYMPVDPALPDERRTALLAQGNVRLVLTQPAFRDGLGWPPGVRVEVAPDDGRRSDTPSGRVRAQPHDLAYVIFTSGSTGVPKGVMIDHRGAVNTIVDVNRRYRVTADDRIFGISSLSFDLSVYDIFGVLAAGACLVLPEPRDLKEPGKWAALVRAEGVTLWSSVPALFEMLTDHCAATSTGDALASLRLGMMSGDWIPVSLPDRIRAQVPNIELHSLGGATEASIWSISFPIGAIDPAWKSIPYGRAMDNQSVVVLDAALAHCPIGVPGHLYIGGIGVALGYWRDAVRTNQSFIAHPRTGERLYRTGDLGRYRADGVIEFLGRRDAQVKVQGYRIELGEIEAALREYPDVRDAVATVRTSGTAKRIVAYVVANQPDGVAAPALTAFVRTKLPEYMVPAAIVILGELPLTANGKVDRRALPEPEVAAGASAIVLPRDALERELAGVWADVLGLPQVSIDADFFDLGGHSLLAVRLMGRIARDLGHPLPIATLFERKTIASLAHLLRGGALPSDPHRHEAEAIPTTSTRSEGAPADRRRATALVTVQSEGHEPPAVWVHPIGGDVLCYAKLARAMGRERPFLALRAPGIDGDAPPCASVEAIAARHLDVLRAAGQASPRVLAGWSFGGLVAYEMARQLEARGEPIETLLLLDSRAQGREADAEVAAGSEIAALSFFLADIAATRSSDAPPELVGETPEAILAHAHALEIVPADVDLAMLRTPLSVFRANLVAEARYRGGPLAQPARIVLLEARASRAASLAAGWRALAAQPIDAVSIAGNHFTALSSPLVEETAAIIRRKLSR
jgi:amino acid adenylation domain-containing protein